VIMGNGQVLDPGSAVKLAEHRFIDL